jgi:hypothetical protein
VLFTSRSAGEAGGVDDPIKKKNRGCSAGPCHLHPIQTVLLNLQ